MEDYLKRAVQKPDGDSSKVRSTLTEILERVRKEGEAAVRYYSEKNSTTGLPITSGYQKTISFPQKGNCPKVKSKILIFVRRRSGILPLSK